MIGGGDTGASAFRDAMEMMAYLSKTLVSVSERRSGGVPSTLTYLFTV